MRAVAIRFDPPRSGIGHYLSSATSRKPWRRRASAKTANYLPQAGVKVTAFRLGDQGHHGNAHMVMLEKNNLQVAAAIAGWLARSVPAW